MMWFDVHAALDLGLALLLHLLQNGLDDLVRDMGHVSAAADRADGIHEAHLLEPALGQAEAHLPPLGTLLVDHRDALPGEEIQVRVVLEVLDVQLLAVQVDGALFRSRAGDVVDPLVHQGDDVIVEGLHAEPREVRLECHPRVRRLLANGHLGRLLLGHVTPESLGKALLTIGGFDDELRGEHVRQLRPVTVPSTHDLAVRIVVVVAGQQVAENHFGDIDLHILVDGHRQAAAIVPHRNRIRLRVDVDLDGVHAFGVADEVVGGVHEDFVEDLVHRGDVANLALHHPALHRVEDPQLLRLRLRGPNISVGSQQDVLELGFLLVNLLDALALAPLGMRVPRRLA
mmetsp:Transcript_76281/g.220327  ORF Transcript_76281/g.220327 Transcript_76281/m.220327 type:complete len:343 (-) Transcript_76281:90-1118(-)